MCFLDETVIVVHFCLLVSLLLGQFGLLGQKVFLWLLMFVDLRGIQWYRLRVGSFVNFVNGDVC